MGIGFENKPKNKPKALSGILTCDKYECSDAVIGFENKQRINLDNWVEFSLVRSMSALIDFAKKKKKKKKRRRKILDIKHPIGVELKL